MRRLTKSIWFGLAILALLHAGATPLAAAADSGGNGSGISPYVSAVLADSPLGYFRLGESGGPSVADGSGHGYTGNAIGGVQFGAAGALTYDANTAAGFSGSNIKTNLPQNAVTQYTLEAWVKTTATTMVTVFSDRRNDAYPDKGFSLFVGPSWGGVAPGVVTFVVNGNNLFNGVYSTRTINDGRWHHLVGVFDAGTTPGVYASPDKFKIYIDGAAQTDTHPVQYDLCIYGCANTPLTGDNTGTRIGGFEDPSVNFVGTIDEAAMYSHALSAERVLAHYQAASKPINSPPVLDDPGPKTVDEGQALTFNVNATDPDAGQTVTITATGLPTGATFANGAFSWRPTFNQSETYEVIFTATDNGSPVQSVSQTVQITVNDVPAIPAPSGLVSLWSAERNTNDAAGQNNGAAPQGVSYNSGMIGQAFSFDGTSKYVGVASPANIPVGNSTYAIAAWIKPQSYNVFGIVGWGNYGTTNQVNAFRLNSGGALINYWWANDLAAQTVVNLADGQFHHVVAMYDGSTRSIWVDGVMRGRDTPSGHNVPNAGNFRIGSTNNGEYFNGLVDEVAIFNRALSASEIQTIYASGGLVPDSSPPVVTPVVTGTLGQNGWYVSAVTVNWTLSDPESGIAFSTGAGTTTLTQDNAGTTLVCTATNGAGLTTSKSVTIKIDQTPPVISASRAPAANGNGWNNTDVTVSFEVSDALSGVANAPGAVTFSHEGADQSASGTVTDKAGNSASASVGHINIDKTAPTLTLLGANPLQMFRQAAYTDPGYTVSDNFDSAPSVTVSNPVNSNVLGSYTVTYDAADQAGNTTAKTRTVEVLNRAPVVTAARPSLVLLWPPNHQLVDISILDVTDPDQDPVTITITGITQDEPINGTGDGDTGPDGTGLGTATAQVRAERAGTNKTPGNGRVYVISYKAADAFGGSSTGSVKVGVLHSQKPGAVCIDNGQVYNSVTGGLAGAVAKLAAAQSGAMGMGNFPNPFNPSTTIAYELPQAAWVQLTIYNLMGQQVRTLVDETQGVGGHTVEWDGRDMNGQRVSAGIYFFRLQAGDQVAVRKMLFAK